MPDNVIPFPSQPPPVPEKRRVSVLQHPCGSREYHLLEGGGVLCAQCAEELPVLWGQPFPYPEPEPGE